MKKPRTYSGAYDINLYLSFHPGTAAFTVALSHLISSLSSKIPFRGNNAPQPVTFEIKSIRRNVDEMNFRVTPD